MSHSIGSSALTLPDKNLVTARPTMARAELHVTSALSSVVTDSAKKVYGKQGAAAAQLGKDEGNFSRDVKAGRVTLNDLAQLGPQFLAEVGRELVEQYGALDTPAARLRTKARELRDIAAELDQAAEWVA